MRVWLRNDLRKLAKAPSEVWQGHVARWILRTFYGESYNA